MYENFFRCPLTGLIYRDPYIADDGYIYEGMAIKDWLAKESKSPTTSKSISTNLIKATRFSELVEEFLKNNPSAEIDRFLNKKPYSLFKNEFIHNLMEKNFEHLIIYTDIILNERFVDDKTIVEFLFTNCKNSDLIKIIINNSVDYDTGDDVGFRPIHIACKHSNQDIIKHLIEKGVDINCADSYGNKPIHYISKYQKNNNAIACYFLESSVDTESYDQDGMMPIHLIAKNLHSWENIEPFINNGCNLEQPSKDGWRPLHYVCRYASNTDAIKKFLELNVNLEVCENIYKKTADELIYENTKISKTDKQKLVLLYLNKVLHKMEVKEDYYGI